MGSVDPGGWTHAPPDVQDVCGFNKKIPTTLPKLPKKLIDYLSLFTYTILLSVFELKIILDY